MKIRHSVTGKIAEIAAAQLPMHQNLGWVEYEEPIAPAIPAPDEFDYSDEEEAEAPSPSDFYRPTEPPPRRRGRPRKNQG